MIAEGLRTENSFLFIFDELNQLFLNSLRVVDSIKLFEVDMKIFIRKCRPRLWSDLFSKREMICVKVLSSAFEAKRRGNLRSEMGVAIRVLFE